MKIPLLLGEKFLSEARGGVPGRGGCQIRPGGRLADDGKRLDTSGSSDGHSLGAKPKT